MGVRGEAASMSASLQALSRSLAHGPGAAAREGPDLGTGILRSFYKQMGEKKQWASRQSLQCTVLFLQDLACLKRRPHFPPWAEDKGNAESYVPFCQEADTLRPVKVPELLLAIFLHDEDSHQPPRFISFPQFSGPSP